MAIIDPQNNRISLKVRFFVRLFSFLPYGLIGLCLTPFAIRQFKSIDDQLIGDNILSFLSDMRAKKRGLVKGVKRAFLLSLLSQYLLSIAFNNRLKRIFDHAVLSDSQAEKIQRDQTALQIFLVHRFGCFHTIAIALARHFTADASIKTFILIDDRDRGYITSKRLQSICDALFDANKVEVIKATEVSSEKELRQKIIAQRSRVIMPSTLSAVMKDFVSVKFMGKDIQVSGCFSSLVNTQQSCSVYTLTSTITVFKHREQELAMTALVLRDSNEHQQLAKRWLGSLIHDLQTQVIQQPDKWLEWVMVEKFYGQPNSLQMGEEMKENFGNFVTGRVEIPAGLRLLSYCMLSFLVTALIFMNTVQYSPSEAVPGYLLATDETIKVKSEYTGQILSVNINEGDFVEESELLYTLQINNQSTGSSTLGDSLASRLKKDIQALKKRIDTLKEEYRITSRTLKNEITNKKEQLVSIDGLIDQQQVTLEILRNYNRRIQSLYRKDLTSRSQVEKERLNLLNAEKELSNFEFRRKGLLNEIQGLRNEINRREVSLRLNVENEAMSISTVEKQLLELSEERVVSIYASKAGFVNNLRVTAGDTLIVDGREIMEITPAATEVSVVQ